MKAHVLSITPLHQWKSVFGAVFLMTELFLPTNLARNTPSKFSDNSTFHRADGATVILPGLNGGDNCFLESPRRVYLVR